MVFPVFWTVFTIFLLLLPGSELPGGGLFSIIGLDKVAHVILFGGIVLFWGFWYKNIRGDGQWRKLVLWTIVLSVVLGIGLEFLQRYAIPNRSFDIGDIWANMGGSVASGLFHLLWPGIGKSES